MRPLRIPRWAAFSALAAGLTLVAGAPVSARPFLSSPMFGVGHNPSRIASADFDQDGLVDIAVANYGNSEPGTVGLLLGLGGGAFRYVGVVYAPGDWYPQTLETDDFNGDGFPDLILMTGCCGNEQVHVLFGQGDGTFVLNQQFGVPGSVHLGRITIDDRPDLIVTAGNGLAVYKCRFDGVFLPMTAGVLPAGIDFTTGPGIVGDLDGDNISDVAGPTPGGQGLTIALGSANGTFTPVQNLPGVIAWGRGTIGDLNGDDAPDLIVETRPDYYLYMGAAYAGLGNGQVAATPFWSSPIDGQTLQFAIGDLNLDGIQDLVTAGPGSVEIRRGDGQGGLVSDGRFVAGDEARQVLIGDFDGAGQLDLAFVAGFSDAVGLILAREDGSYTPRRAPTLDHVSGGAALAVADVNNDGRLDLIQAHVEPDACLEESCPWSETSVALGLEGGGYGPKTSYPTGMYPESLLVQDLTSDGRPDIVSVNIQDVDGAGGWSPGNVSILVGNGDGTFQPERRYDVGIWPRQAAAGDFNVDGILDLAVVSDYGGTVTTLRGVGDGSFVVTQTFASGLHTRRVRAADFDGDFKPDLVIVNHGYLYTGVRGDVSFLRGRGDMTFDPRLVLARPILPASLETGDLDQDGDPDLLVADEGDSDYTGSDIGGALILRNLGNGGFAELPILRSGLTPIDSTIADVNGDGTSDLMIFNRSRDISVFPGQGGAAFGLPTRYADFGCGDFVTGETNVDGRVDLIGLCWPGVAIVNNQGPAVPDLRAKVDRVTVRWDPMEFIEAYDAVRGDLASLVSSGGDFGVAVDACVESRGPLNWLTDEAMPPVGGGFFYLSRPIQPNGSLGTYDGEGPGQIGPRDGLIAAAAGACP